MRSPGPQQNRPSVVVLSEAETARVRRFVKSCTSRDEARRRLGVGGDVMDAAREFGRMQSATRMRLLEALAREEAKVPSIDAIEVGGADVVSINGRLFRAVAS